MKTLRLCSNILLAIFGICFVAYGVCRKFGVIEPVLNVFACVGGAAAIVLGIGVFVVGMVVLLFPNARS